MEYLNSLDYFSLNVVQSYSFWVLWGPSFRSINSFTGWLFITVGKVQRCLAGNGTYPTGKINWNFVFANCATVKVYVNWLLTGNREKCSPTQNLIQHASDLETARVPRKLLKRVVRAAEVHLCKFSPINSAVPQTEWCYWKQHHWIYMSKRVDTELWTMNY